MTPNPGQDTSSNPLPSFPDTSTHERPQNGVNKRQRQREGHYSSTRSYSQRQLDRMARVQAELQKVKEECEALELYVWQLEGEREWLRGVLGEIMRETLKGE
ncbi:hypothetical protein ABOM_005890 [Aspergillus bombycis]|uniref:BZIP transcription factor n=1 Tax=Aspergillus bombycis TaxID=109264 RepID=A0A1F8A0J6_9EURO|nr:hypothetical protein ABOM_005890 [Aspergillus bombycis]OGM45231.1 hypothetical protein ABOM_005890 [Aspergillus bombycis]